MRVIKTLTNSQINSAQKNLEMMRSTTQYLAQQQIKLGSSQIESLMRETLIQNPRNVMAKGSGIVRNQGKAIHSIKQISADRIQVELQDGTIKEVVPLV